MTPELAVESQQLESALVEPCLMPILTTVAFEQDPSEVIPRAPTPIISDQAPEIDAADDSGVPEAADPGCLDDERPRNNDSGAYEEELEAIFETAQLNDLRLTVQFIQALQSASLDDEHNAMDSKCPSSQESPN